MEKKESQTKVASSESPQAEPASSGRRAFMKTVVTGTVAAGALAAASKAEAAMAGCGEVALPSNPVKVKVLFNARMPPSLSQLHDLIDRTIGQSGCPECGLGGVIRPDVGIVYDISFEMAHMPETQESLVLMQDVAGLGKY